MTSEYGLLSPGAHRAAGMADDDAVVAAMGRVEIAWLRALAFVGVVDAEDADKVSRTIADSRVDATALRDAAEATGNPVVPYVAAIRSSLDQRLAASVHRGLTSQDVLDTAVMLLARDALGRVRGDLTAIAARLAELADRHRDSVMVGRTLTQHAVPTTFGLKAAQWLSGVLDARDRVDAATASLPVQCGGAAGTLALVGEMTDAPVAAAAAFADELGLVWPGLPWHTNRAPITGIGDALVAACDALGVIAADVALLSRPEIAEVREGAVAGRGGSSTMPHKRNPVLSILVRSAALQAPQLGSQLHIAAAQAVDERPDGAWHSEWPAHRRLLELAVVAASQASELVAGLEVDAAAMRVRADAAADELLAERGRTGDPAEYLGAATTLIDTAITRVSGEGPHHG
jgi:3-carboxy-cis,cis-muconate cycloisomerase